MEIKHKTDRINLAHPIHFGMQSRKIDNPVETQIKKSGIKISGDAYKELAVETYMTKEEIRTFESYPPVQQKRISDAFRKTPEYRKFKRAVTQVQAEKEKEGGSSSRKVSTGDAGPAAKPEQGQKYVQLNSKAVSYSQEQGSGYAAGTKVKADEIMPQTQTEVMHEAAAAGSAGTEKVIREAAEAVKKYADTIKESVETDVTSPADTDKKHSGDIALSENSMGFFEKAAAMVMALVTFVVTQFGVILLPLIMVVAIVILVTTLLISVISSIAAAITDNTDKLINGIKKDLLSHETVEYVEQVKTAAEENDVPEYVNYLLAIMEVESHGKGTDVMQSSGSAGLPAESFTKPEDSIRQGVKYFSECIRLAREKECDIKTAVQAYNYGTGFIDYVSENGNSYTLELAVSFAQEKSGGTKIDYTDQAAVDYNGGWRYDYGNMFYVQLVDRYVYHYENDTVQKVVDEAMRFYGWDYVSGGCSPDDGGFDCSGLVQYVYGQAGIELPRLEKEQFEASVEIPVSEIQPGDLLFYKNETSLEGIGHVAIYIGDGKVYEAGDPIGVYPADDKWHKDNFLCAGRVIDYTEE